MITGKLSRTCLRARECVRRHEGKCKSPFPPRRTYGRRWHSLCEPKLASNYIDQEKPHEPPRSRHDFDGNFRDAEVKEILLTRSCLGAKSKGRGHQSKCLLVDNQSPPITAFAVTCGEPSKETLATAKSAVRLRITVEPLSEFAGKSTRHLT
jgi:hypothetical protein